ncbi:Fc.00g086490.m01.CDS01 [Cosmosporella sp. VM-42]
MEYPRDGAEHTRPASSISDHEKTTSIASSRRASCRSTSSVNQEDDDDVSPASNQKAADILAACRWRDIGRLRLLAEAEGGFLTDALRRRAWPILLGLKAPTGDANDSSSGTSDDGLLYPDDAACDWKELPRHRDEDQVQLDVNRSFIYYPSNRSEAELKERKSELSALITEVLRRYPYLCYFQGYHDICQVFLLVLEPAWRARVVARLSVLRIRDFMLPSLGPTTAQLRLLPDILGRADPKLRQHLAGIEPFYALAGTLTMYAHNIEGYRDIARLFDVFLAREPVFSIYMFAQIILDRRDEIYEFDEPDMLHVILGKIPREMDLDGLIATSVKLFERFPPESLRYWSQISSSSSLKSARDVEACAKQSMDEGEEHFKKQARELRWTELQDKVKWALWAYRRPATTIGAAVAVGAVAIYLRRNPTTINHIVALFS